MVASQGLVRTGALEPVGRSLAGLWGVSPRLSLLVTLLVAGLLSAVVNNTPIVVLLLPILTSVSLRTGAPASSVLMPMGFATRLPALCEEGRIELVSAFEGSYYFERQDPEGHYCLVRRL